MKRFFLMGISATLLVIASCNKVKTYGNLPGIADAGTTQSLVALRAWVEQIALQKADSIRVADSLAALSHKVDTNTLFGKKNLMVAIVEANDHYVPNVNCYLDQKGRPVFDLAMPFAANLNIDPTTGKAYVSYNPEWQAMLGNGTFRVVQTAGIPVGLSLLGNHDAAGWSNFASLADATDFAQLVAIQVRQHGFSAVMSDDEYSNPVSNADPNSYVMVMSEIKRLLPDIFLCYYDIGTGGGSYKGKQMGDIADAMFPPSYPEYAYNSYNFPNSKTFASCSEEGGGFSDPAGTAAQLKSEGRKGFMFYNVWGTPTSAAFYAPYFSALKGVTLTASPGCLNGNEANFINGQ